MKILFMGNNWAAWKAAAWLKERGENISLAILHPSGRERYRSEIISALALPPEKVLDGSALKSSDTLQKIRDEKPDIALSVFFGYLVPKEILTVPPKGVVNLHPSLLPYNRGAYPNVWPIVEKTPAGASLHYLDEGIDTGDLITQREVRVDDTDTGETLYRRLEQASLDLLISSWDSIKNGTAPRSAQSAGGSVHRAKDAEAIDSIDLNQNYRAGDLINILRARTFPPYKGAYFTDAGGKKIYMRLELKREEPDV